MKKVFAGLFLSLVLIVGFSSQVTIHRAQAVDCGDGSLEAINGGPLCVPKNQFNNGGFTGSKTVGEFMFKLIQVLLILCAVVAILFIVIGGFRYMTSSGNQEAADKGKKMITSAIIGLIIVILSYTIVTVLINTITKQNVIGTGGNTNTTGNQTCTIVNGTEVCTPK